MKMLIKSFWACCLCLALGAGGAAALSYLISFAGPTTYFVVCGTIIFLLGWRFLYVSMKDEGE
ncbi:hypothetical protein [Porticoccus sp.]